MTNTTRRTFLKQTTAMGLTSSLQRESTLRAIAGLALLLLFSTLARAEEPKVGQQVARQGDEIMVCGQLFHTTAPVVLWLDPGGYDAYRVERRFSPLEKSSWKDSVKEVSYLDTPNRYGLRKAGLNDKQLQQVRGGGWDLPLLQKVVDQFVIHYDVCGTSRKCFQVLQDGRGLSVHFLLDIDGTIYQTLDLKERAWHATRSNSRSVGIEIAQIGAYPKSKMSVLKQWYTTDSEGEIRLRPPRRMSPLGLRTQDFEGRPDRQGLIVGTIQGTELYQYDFTPQQYDSLIKLTATLCRIFPQLKCTYPRDDKGQLIPHLLTDAAWKQYQGLLGHYHIQKNKTDPGPAFNWEKVIAGASQLLQ